MREKKIRIIKKKIIFLLFYRAWRKWVTKLWHDIQLKGVSWTYAKIKDVKEWKDQRS